MPTLESLIDAKIRDQFPVLRTTVNGLPLTYLDNAATSQKPAAVLDALDQYWKSENSNVHRGVHHLSQIATAKFDRARESIRDLLNAREAEEVVFTKGCTEAVNLVASGLTHVRREDLRLKSGDTILVSTMEHHSNIVPWQLAADRTGAKVLPIPISDEGELDQEGFLNLLKNSRPKLVAIKHVCNALGTINPLKWIIHQAHAYGALVMVDGAQAGPHLRIDVQELDADFYTLSCHKMYAPTGVGVLYGKREFLEALPPYQGGGDMIRTVSFDGTTYAEIPSKFEAGTPNVAGVIGLGAAAEWIRGLGKVETDSDHDSFAKAYERIHAHERILASRAESLLCEVPGVRVVGNAREKTGIVSFVMESAHPHDIGTILDSQGIAVRAGHHCCMPLMKRLGLAATVRASFSLYNTLEEVDRLAAGVRKVQTMFG
jgi:cysteine desulfurase/selenocysteine lyase